MSRRPDSAPGAGRVVLEDYAAVAEAIAATARAARHRLRIYAPACDPRLFAGTALAEAVGALATRNARNRVRILMADPAPFLQSLPRLLALVRRLPTYVEARRVDESRAAPTDMFVLADRTAYVHQPHVDQVKVFADPGDGRTTSQLVRRFDAQWDSSEPIAGISTLGL